MKKKRKHKKATQAEKFLAGILAGIPLEDHEVQHLLDSSPNLKKFIDEVQALAKKRLEKLEKWEKGVKNENKSST